MEVNGQMVLAVTEASHAGEVRRRAGDFARAAGLDDTAAGRMAIVATEAATNLLKHARGGEMLLGHGRDAGGPTVHLVALDRGPGISDLSASMRDGFSTAGSPGTGLGAMRRLATSFDVYSDGNGTAVVCEIGNEDGSARARDILLAGAVCVPMPGEHVCGDAWDLLVAGDGQSLLCVVDGLGHGPDAAAASLVARDVVRRHTALPPVEIVRRLHDALRGTRGAAASIALLDRSRRLVRFVGVGNVAGSVIADGTLRHMVTHHGTLGHDIRRIDEFTYPWPPGAVVLLHSDGIGSRWDLARYPGLLQRHPRLLAALLYRDFRRERDDATVVAVREAA